MKFIVAGDLHGRLKHLIEIEKSAKAEQVNLVIQVGDFGINWPGEECSINHYFKQRANQKLLGPNWISCLGNHDNYNYFEELQRTQPIKTIGYLTNTPRKYLIRYQEGLYATPRPYWNDELNMLFMGGAISSDADMRVEDKSWWRQECPTQEQFNEFEQLLNDKKPKYVITHDGPLCATNRHDPWINPKSKLETTYVAQQFQKIYERSSWKPKHWFYGHHHEITQQLIDQTYFRCCGLHGDYWLVDQDYYGGPDLVQNFIGIKK